MDQEAEEGKDKAGPDKQGKSPQVFEHAAWMGSLARNGALLCSRGPVGVTATPREDLFNKEGFGVTPSQVSVNFGVLLQVGCHTKLVPRWEWQDSLLELLAEQS